MIFRTWWNIILDENPGCAVQKTKNKICARNENLLHLKILDALSRSAKDPMNV